MAYVPPFHPAALCEFADRLRAAMPPSVPVTLMGVSEALARAAGYPNAHAAHQAAKGARLRSAGTPVLPTVSARRLRDWAGPLHKVWRAQPDLPPLTALAQAWGHRSAWDLTWTLGNVSFPSPLEGYLRRRAGRPAWEALPESPSAASPPTLVLGQDHEGTAWAMDASRTCTHTAIFGEAVERSALVANLLTQSHRQGQGWLWLGTDRAQARRLAQAMGPVHLADWSLARGPDLDLDGVSSEARGSLQYGLLEAAWQASDLPSMDPTALSAAVAVIEGLLAQWPDPTALGLSDLLALWCFWLGDSFLHTPSVLAQELAPALSAKARPFSFQEASRLLSMLQALRLWFTLPKANSLARVTMATVMDASARTVWVVPSDREDSPMPSLVRQLIGHYLSLLPMVHLTTSLTWGLPDTNRPPRRLWVSEAPWDTWASRAVFPAQARAIGMGLVWAHTDLPPPALQANVRTLIGVGASSAWPSSIHAHFGRVMGTVPETSAGEGLLWTTNLPEPRRLTTLGDPSAS